MTVMLYEVRVTPSVPYHAHLLRATANIFYILFNNNNRHDLSKAGFRMCLYFGANHGLQYNLDQIFYTVVFSSFPILIMLRFHVVD